MQSFIAKHADKISGVLSCFDRVIMRGHLPMASVGYFRGWMHAKKIAYNRRILQEGWRNFKEAAPWFAAKMKAHLQSLAARHGRLYDHLRSHNEPMEDNARALAERHGITHGLVCIYSCLETCRTFRIRYGQEGPELGPDLRVCTVFYSYWMDRAFGLMHVKIQSWFPFTVQVYVNGHEWLARQLARQGIGFTKVENAFVELTDAAKAQRCLPAFWQRDWPRFLDGLARQVNPFLDDWLAGQNYYWVIDEAEWSTDVLFAERQALADLRPRLCEHAFRCFGAAQIMTFLGRKYRETFAGDVKTYWHRREPGAAVRHCVKRNVLKMYDKAGAVLRIETVINQAKEFFVHRTLHKQNGTKEVGWFPLTKAVANLYRFAQVGQRANERYLEALAVVNDWGVGQRELERRCAPVVYRGRTRRALQPLAGDDQALFQAALRGEHALRGFRNGELAQLLYGPSPDESGERRRRCGRVSRRISLLRAHGLVAKIPRSRRYRVTARGQRFMSTAIHLRTELFPKELSGQ
ncbi:MAG TPA: hypothetical protein VGY66_05180 [Gemmataceae bacterium]|jgi:hypothetical protein|nr:hypothetical protein [Gemmataceae bacterium]